MSYPITINTRQTAITMERERAETSIQNRIGTAAPRTMNTNIEIPYIFAGEDVRCFSHK